MDLVIAAIILVLSSIIFLPIFKSYTKNRRISRYIDQLPGDKWYPVVGTTWKSLTASRESYFDVLKSRHDNYGPFVRNWLGSIPVVNIYKPEHAQVIFRSNTIVNKGGIYKFLFPWLGQGLISGSGPKWREHRKIITPSFHFKILDRYGETFVEKSEEFVKYLEQFDGKGYFEITEHLTRIALDIITETAMGVKLNSLQKKDKKHLEYAGAIVNFSTIAHKRFYNPLLANDFIFKRTKLGKLSQSYTDIIHNFNSHVIQTRKEQFQAQQNDLSKEDDLGRKAKFSFLDMLLAHQQNNKFEDSEIEEEVNTFMFGGQDTTVSTLTFTFMALGNYPDILKKIHEELDVIFADDPNRKISSQDIARMEYLDRVLKEVLRCYCFVPFLGRELHEDVVIDDVLIPKGANVMIGLYNLHHDQDHYPDPYKFDPDRFLPENSAKRHPYAFVPFSAGPRNCLGQKFGIRNVKTLLSYILRKYTVTCQERAEDVKYYLEIVLRPQNGLHIAIESRRKN